MGQKLPVMWAPERVTGAIERLQAVLDGTDPDRFYELRSVQFTDGDSDPVFRGRMSWMDLAVLRDIAVQFANELERAAEPITDGPWTIGPAPGFVRYQVVGEEDAEELVMDGHDISSPSIAAVIEQAGFKRLLEYAYKDLGVAELQPFKTWAREVTDCPKHGWIPQWLRQWLWQRWEHALEDCAMCTHVVHYRTCQGCGFCSSDGSGRVPSCLDVITEGHRLFYLPGELETINARLAQLRAAGTDGPHGPVIEPGAAKEFQGLVDGARAIREDLELRGYGPVTVVNLAG